MRELISSSFKIVVFLLQGKVPPRFRLECCGLSMLLSIGVADIQTFYFKNGEVDMFIPQTESKDPKKFQFFLWR